MPPRGFDIDIFINDAIIAVEATALAWTRDDGEGKKKRLFLQINQPLTLILE
jgi:hypothetical protein